ncbi:MAG: BACON domain-containing protein [Bacteroidales bacterium]
MSRTSVPSSAYRNFESSFNSSDLITLRIDYDDTRLVEGVTINGVNTPYTTRIIDANHYLFANVLVEPSNVKTVVVNYVDESVPRIILSENQLNFNAVEGENPVAQTFNVTSNLPQLLNWTAAVSSSDGNWLSINPTSGTGTTAVTVNVDVSGLVSGTYTKTITVSAVGASNTPQVKTVTLLVTPAGYLHIDFNYTDREALVSNGRFSYNECQVSPRNTEQLSGAVVSFDQIAHPGACIPVGSWQTFGLQIIVQETHSSEPFRRHGKHRMKVASFNPTANYQAVSLVAYQDDDHYMEVSRGYNSVTPLLL